MPDALFFSSAFDIDERLLEAHGAFNISVFNDLPLFIDPFLYFNSDKKQYQRIHEEMIKYLIFLKNTAQAGPVSNGLRSALFTFPEVKQNWLGFSESENYGRGLGDKFASSIINGFNGALRTFGDETISDGTHLEKVCLIHPGIGKDFISDFSTNMSLGYLADYTQDFAVRHLPEGRRKSVPIRRSSFSYTTNTWVTKTYTLPWINDDFVLLTPKDVLTKDEAWINQRDLFGGFDGIIESLPNEALRAQVDYYFRKRIAEFKKPAKDDIDKVVAETINKWPLLIDYFIKTKEDSGDRATSIANGNVQFVDHLFVQSVRRLVSDYLLPGGFPSMPKRTKEEAMKRLLFLKDVIENKGGHRLFWWDGKSIERESDLQILYRLTWIGTALDISRERNDGRGPVDFAASLGAHDKTLIEFKLAKNSKLKQNLEHQTAVYEKASDSTEPSIKAIFYFTEQQFQRVRGILSELKLSGDPNIVLIDVRADNKPSGSHAA